MREERLSLMMFSFMLVFMTFPNSLLKIVGYLIYPISYIFLNYKHRIYFILMGFINSLKSFKSYYSISDGILRTTRFDNQQLQSYVNKPYFTFLFTMFYIVFISLLAEPFYLETMSRIYNRKMKIKERLGMLK
jgi:hypothetical protein